MNLNKKVVEDIKISQLTYQEAADKHNVKSKTQIMNWERIYLEEGPEGLYIEHVEEKKLEAIENAILSLIKSLKMILLLKFKDLERRMPT